MGEDIKKSCNIQSTEIERIALRCVSGIINTDMYSKAHVC